MILDETYTLSNGVEIPKLGLGTWFITDDVAAQAGSVGRIQEGVNLAAGTGALTVDVKAGAYPEQVLVEKALLLTGAAKASTVSFPATRADDPVTATQNLLTIGNGAAALGKSFIGFASGRGGRAFTLVGGAAGNREVHARAHHAPTSATAVFGGAP